MIKFKWLYLRFAVAERGSRVSQGVLNPRCVRMRVAENATRDPFRVLEGRHGLVEIVERGSLIFVERPRVSLPHLEREFMTLSECASRQGHQIA